MNSSLPIVGHSSPHYDSSSYFVNPIQIENTPSKENWLPGHLSRLPFQIYRIWLVLTLCLVVYINGNVLFFLWTEIKNAYSLFLTVIAYYDPTIVAISCIFQFFGCYEMFFAIERRKSEMAHKGILKFIYSFGLLLSNSIFYMYWAKFIFTYYSKMALFVAFILPVIAAVSWIGGFAVIRAFQMNHPLLRMSAALKSEDPNLTKEDDDFLKQNKFIASKLSESDEKLESWIYLIFKWWLKFAVVLEIMQVPQNIVFKVARIARDKKFSQLLEFILPFLAHTLSAYCSYDMEVVLKTRILKRSKRAIFLLKICIVMSTIVSIATPLLVQKNNMLVGEYLSKLLLNLRNCVLIPLVTFIGALMADKVLEEREGLVKASSFPNDCNH